MTLIVSPKAAWLKQLDVAAAPVSVGPMRDSRSRWIEHPPCVAPSSTWQAPIAWAQSSSSGGSGLDGVGGTAAASMPSAGRSTAKREVLPALSFEFLPAVRDVALGCVDRLETLGRYRYAASLDGRLQLLPPERLTAAAMRAWLLALGPQAPSGDVHAWLDLSAPGSEARPGP